MLRPRTVLLALGGTILIALFVQWSDILVGGTMAAGPFPPLAAALLWGLLFAANRATGNRLLTGSELRIVLAIWVAANVVAGRGLLHPLLSSLVGPVYYARSGAVTGAVRENLPSWLAVTDRVAARAYFEGHGVAVPWGLWRGPLTTWGMFFAFFLTANVSLCAVFERAWVRNERLAYPLVALPLELTEPPKHGTAGPFRGPVFWGGVAFPLLLHGFGAAHAYLPGMPCIPFFNDVSSAVTQPPWTAALPLYVNIYPLLIGVIFLAPTDVTLGIWFFLVLNKVEMIATAAFGWNEGATGSVTSTFPFVEEQSAGAFLMLGGMLFWSARHQLRTVWRSPDTRPFATALAVCVVGLLLWCVWTGLPFWFACAFFGFVLIVNLVLARLMSEGGVPWILAPILPDKLILSLTGSAALSPVAITRLALHTQHLRDTRQLLTPTAMQSGKLRDEAGAPFRRFYALLLGSAALALVVGTMAALPLFYNRGALSLAPNSDGLQMAASVLPTTAVAQASTRLLTPVHPNFGAGMAILFGAGITWLLTILRLRAAWWPLHPLGYALTGTLQLGYANKMLCSIMLGWAFKSLALRFGGARAFRLLRDAALGLIFGDLLMGGVLKLLDALLGPSGYAIF